MSKLSLAQQLRNLCLVADTARRHLSEDPMLLAVQSARRLPDRARRRLSHALTWGAAEDSLRYAVGSFIEDRREAAREALCALAPGSISSSRLAAELAIQLGLDPTVALAAGRADGRASLLASLEIPPRTLARQMWSRGDLSAAIRAVDAVPSARTVHARLRSELALMSPGFSLPRVQPSRRWSGPTLGDAPRVLHVLTNSFPHTQSGYAVRSHALLQAEQAAGVKLRAVTRIGYPVTVGRMKAAVEDEVDGVIYRRLLPARLAPMPAARLVQMSRLLAQEVEDFKPDLLHTTTNFHNALVTRCVAQSYDLPWVYEMRGVLELTWVASRPVQEQAHALASQRYRLLRDRETEMALAANAVVVLSHVQKQDLCERGVPADKITVVPNAVDDAVIEDVERGQVLSPADARVALGLPAEGVWFGSVSSIVDYEGFDVLLEAIARCRADGIDVRCLIVGSGVALPGLRERARALGLSPDVCVLPGRQPSSQALAWYQALDVFCVPRLDTPVCRMVTPIKPLTAAALGRYLLVSDLPALREVAKSAEFSAVPAGDVGAWREAIMRAAVPGRSLAPAGSSLPRWKVNGQINAALYEELR